MPVHFHHFDPPLVVAVTPAAAVRPAPPPPPWPVLMSGGRLLQHGRFAALLFEGLDLAGHGVAAAPVIDQVLFVDTAALPSIQTPGVEPTSRRRVHRTGYISRQDDAVPPESRMRDGHGREQCLGVR